MSATITLSGDWLNAVGSTMQTQGVGNLGVYATGGIAVTPNKFGLGFIDRLVIDAAGGYTFKYNAATGKVQAFCGDGGVAAHTHDLTIIGGQAPASTAAAAYYATDILGKEAATDKTIAGADSATKGGVGSAVSTSGVEVTDTTNLTTAVFNWRAQGR